MDKIGIVTVFTGYNYGSLLQAYASQEFIKTMGYDAHLLWTKQRLAKGRDVRIRKILAMGIRAIIQPKAFKIGAKGYISANNQHISKESKDKFQEFTNKNLQIKHFSYDGLKKIANSISYRAFVCGSDQIWNSTAIYVDPLYYLRFAPKTKRIAYAPSFGKDYIPDYNREKFKKFISEFEYLSIREKKGQDIIRSLIGKAPPVLLDPIFLLEGDYWRQLIKPLIEKPYILFYFLNEPNENTKIFLKNIQGCLKKKVVVLPVKALWHDIFDNVESIDAGPLEFISLIYSADFVCTDSFHGMAFSINLNTPFIILKREYSSANDQSSRIISLLNMLGLENRYIRDYKFIQEYSEHIDFLDANTKLAVEREKSVTFLKNAIGDITDRLTGGAYRSDSI